MSDRFPYNLPSREALVRLAAETTGQDYESAFVSFDDMFFAPLQTVPGRTFIEMSDRKTGFKFWYMYRRLDLAIILGEGSLLRVVGVATPASIAREINRSRGMMFGPDDLSFSNVPIERHGYNVFRYRIPAMTGSYAYYGEVEIIIEVIDDGPSTRLLEDKMPRQLEDGEIRFLEDQDPTQGND